MVREINCFSMKNIIGYLLDYSSTDSRWGEAF